MVERPVKVPRPTKRQATTAGAQVPAPCRNECPLDSSAPVVNDAGMAEVVPFPHISEVFRDERGDARAMRVTWHGQTVVLSLWREDQCRASFRMPAADVPALITALVCGLAAPPAPTAVPQAAESR
jgi:hypothetical protein